MSPFELSEVALQSSCPGNIILYDDRGMPSVMVKIPKMTYAELGLGDSEAVHPAFIVNGKEVEAIYLSKYQNIVQNGRAYSLPCQDPANNIDFDTAREYCEAKGEGWHIMTRAEWAAIALWCKQNGLSPYGNNDYGKDQNESNYTAIPTYKDNEGKICRVATGTGPVEWSHDRTPSGIWDLNGNVGEWVGGIRTVYGEIQILINNNAADSYNSQSATSTEWKAIDATTGELIAPDGNGTTQNSIKVDYISNVVTYSTNVTVKSISAASFLYAITCDGTISDNAKNVLYALALLKLPDVISSYDQDSIHFNTDSSEALIYCGGAEYAKTSSGIYTVYCNPRNAKTFRIGFRCAYIKPAQMSVEFLADENGSLLADENGSILCE